MFTIGLWDIGKITIGPTANIDNICALAIMYLYKIPLGLAFKTK